MANFKDIQLSFTRHIKDPVNNPPPNGVEERRMTIYRDLFYNNIHGFLSNGFPVLKSIYGDELWNKRVREYFSSHQSHSPYFVDISAEFVNYLQNEYTQTPEDPPFLLELAHYEWLELELSIRRETGFQHYWQQGSDVTRVVFSELATLASYHFPVHQIKPDYQPQQPGEAIFIVVYRNRHQQVEFTLVNQVSAHLITLLQEPRSLDELTEQMAAAMPQLPKDQVAQGMRSTVQALLEKDVLMLVD